MSEKEITTAAIADFVKAQSPIAAPAVGKHFGQPYWTGEIERAAKPLIESGQIAISSEQGVVWVESPEPKRIETQQIDGDPLKGKPLIDENKAVTEQMSDDLPSTDAENEPLERFSFFDKGLSSAEAKSTGTIEQFINQVRTNAAWKYRIEEVRMIKDESEQKAMKEDLPAVTVSVEITSVSKRRGGLTDGEFVHTNLIQADFDNHPAPNALLDELKQDKHVRACFASPREKAKAFIKVSPVTTIHEHDSAWEAVKQYCIAQGYGEIDTKPKAVNALCYISHDPHAILKDAIPLTWDPLPEPSTSPTRPITAPTATNNEKPAYDQMREMLSFIDADDYEIWMGIGMGLYREGYGFELWDQWSQKSIKYGQPPTTAENMKRKWETFGKESARSQIKPITLGSIFHHAKEGGWQQTHRQEYRHGYYTHRLIYRRR